MSEPNKLRKLIAFLTGILLIVMITQLNFSDLSFKTNWRMYIPIFSAILVIISLFLSNRYDSKKEKNV